jgi:dTMP kinase
MAENDDTRGFLITFEGSEGSGKSTQVARMAERFERANYEVIVTREPGGTPIGEEIRHVLIHSDAAERMKPETELLLFAASRAQLVREVIRPALDAGKIVLCDRFLDSTTVYQGVGRRIAAEPVHMINTFAVGNVMPDVTVVVDVPAEIGLARARHRVRELPDRMEQENIEFYHKVRQGYLMLAKALPERFIIADGTQTIEEVEEQIWAELRKRVI